MNALRPGYTLTAPSSGEQRDATLGLFEAVRRLEPDVVTPVHRGLTTLESWVDRKQAAWVRLVLTDTGEVVGHVAVARTPAPHPLWGTLPPEATWELTRLLVHPDHRRHGLARALVTCAQDTFTHGLWATPRRDAGWHQLLTSLGWQPVDHPVGWGDATGVLLLAPAATG